MLLVTAAEMRAIDRHTIEGGHASGADLMDRAGAGVVDAMERRYGPVLALRVLVLCGRGNNGGDGFVCARRLQAAGAEPRVAVLGDPGGISGDARTHLDAMRRAGIEARAIDSEQALHALIADRDAWDFALDAMLGTGARGAPEGLIAAGVQALRDMDDAGTRVVAVDLPTGLDADTGTIARRTVRADLTVTFGWPKRGQILYPGRAFVGSLEVVDIGLVTPPAVEREAPELATDAAMAALVPARDPRAHKGSVGRVLAVGGSVGLTGAIALAAQASTRAGAGYVHVAVPESLNDILEVKLTEEITLPMPETKERALASAAFDSIVDRSRACDALVVGPGLSRAPEAADLARRLVASVARPMVIDADAINAFEGRPDLLASAGGVRVITPHLGEMSRLDGTAVAELEARRIDAARERAASLRAVVVLKGAPTVTAAPDGRVTVNPTGNPGLATLGTGDVLAGAIGALLAQGLDPYDAARLAVYVHGAAGDRAAASIGQHGMRAGDLLDTLPLALQALDRLREEGGPRGEKTKPAR
jgi:NAD(P)H-hydrate epimerase